MKKHALLILLLTVCINVFSQKSPDPVYTIVEVMPVYPGGQDAMIKFIGKNTVYPKSAKDGGKTGTVYITFVVDTSGNISNATVLRGVANAPELDAEALRVVNSMPAWTPGTQNGRKVRVQYNLPIKFSLTGKTKKKKKKKG